MRQLPEYDLKFQYRRVLEWCTVIALALCVAALIASKKFETSAVAKVVDIPQLQVEDIPVTRTLKRSEAPRKPTIPVEDPEISPEADVDIPDVDIISSEVQPPPPPPAIEEEIVPFFKVEVQPQLIGGPEAIAEYIKTHDLFPRIAREAGVSGKVLIGFVVNRDGVPTDVHVIQEKPPGLGFGEAGVKVMQAMRFTPGMQRDRAVSVSMQQPITFTFE